MLVNVLAKTGASENTITFGLEEHVYLVSVTAQPLDGKANEAVAKIIAKYFDVPKSCVVLKRGATNRHKAFEVSN